MTEIKIFVCNAFYENSYVLFDESSECIIIDPGFSNAYEQQQLLDFLKDKKLTPIALINTHCHVDHVLGNKFIFDHFGLTPLIHQMEENMLAKVIEYAPMYGFNYEPSPHPQSYLKEGESICFGNSSLKILFTPGHAPGHICLYHSLQNFVIGGDVLFQNSIGRTDLPFGDYDELIKSIHTQLLPLSDDCIVYPGHGNSTTIGNEKKHNPFLQQ